MLLLFLTFFSFLLLSWAIYKVKLVYQIGRSEQNRLFLVILCLNYDGKFGLNNMNSYFQKILQSKFS